MYTEDNVSLKKIFFDRVPLCWSNPDMSGMTLGEAKARSLIQVSHMTTGNPTSGADTTPFRCASAQGWSREPKAGVRPSTGVPTGTQAFLKHFFMSRVLAYSPNACNRPGQEKVLCCSTCPGTSKYFNWGLIQQAEQPLPTWPCI